MKSLRTLLLASGVCSLSLPAFSQDLTAEPRVIEEFAASAEPNYACQNNCIYECQQPEHLVRFSIPAWLPEFHGTATVRGVSAPVNVSTRDLFKLVDDIDMIVVGRLDLQSGRFGVHSPTDPMWTSAWVVKTRTGSTCRLDSS